MRFNRTIVFCFFAFALISAQAGEMGKPYVGSKAFEKLKQLVGSWEGSMDMGQGPMKITASYRLTSGGSAIVETCFEGAPHEMISVYHDDPAGKLNMTHYCALHNQPKMALSDLKDNELTLTLTKDAPIDANEMHMNAVRIVFEGADKMTQHWTKSDQGKKQSMPITYTRVK